LGALLITKIQLAAMSRVDTPEAERKDFYLYVDEFQNFATESFANILSEARKYRLNLIIGHQYIAQMDEIVRDAVFGNVGTLAVFRVGAEDAEFLEKEFSPEFTAEDLVNLSKYNIYLKLMIDGVASHPFSAQTLVPPTPLVESNREKIIQASRDTYSVKSSIVEDKITRWIETQDTAPGAAATAQKKPQKPVGMQDNATTLYDAICSMCGKATKTIFQPEKGRTVYCKSCLKKIKNTQIKQKEEKAPSELLQAKEGAAGTEVSVSAIENISFNAAKKGTGFHEQKELKPASFNNTATKRKEINLSELKKVLQESMEKELVNPQPPKPVTDAPLNSLKNQPLAESENLSAKDSNKKELINPGEKIIL
jgi:CxxC-x17-CxxC domain-containing protein